MTRAAHQIHALQSLAAMGGTPMPDATLRASLRLAFRHDRITETQVEQCLRALDAEGHLIGLPDGLTREVMWSLTAKGEAAAARHA